MLQDWNKISFAAHLFWLQGTHYCSILTVYPTHPVVMLKGRNMIKWHFHRWKFHQRLPFSFNLKHITSLMNIHCLSKVTCWSSRKAFSSCLRLVSLGQGRSWCSKNCVSLVEIWTVPDLGIFQLNGFILMETKSD